MTMSDPIADMLTRIRNAQMRVHPAVAIPHSRVKESIARVLKEEGYIQDYEVIPEHPQPILRVTLKYVGDRRRRRSVISALERVSKPGRRVYVDKKNIPWVLQGMGIAILTTSKGVMTGQQARRLGVGGEVLCRIY
ncbi:MAG: 30S ribosomal protein S8 [Anaerolineae bacterium]|nr:30S ribosomal protein S8 [Anaerolineae bacterium]MCO5187330.1 30S ribosomal protein S8 [Anaerolineae bacterium]MCO5193916.1 30S ribosomal protein S8 [Anaerolineae bacterium]MCO5196243.1 30S ribosomal protein S8 [Anaerolineae bacterium]MCO5204467.1 30S ribosomal protein S8 [Anaerolineae bacterium]